MRNLFKCLGVNRHDSVDQLQAALRQQQTPTHDADPDLFGVMSTPDWLESYRRMHLQYEAMAQTLSLLQTCGNESLQHRWAHKLEEFDTKP